MQDNPEVHPLDFLRLGVTTMAEHGCVKPMRAHRDDGGPMRGEVMLKALLETDAARGIIVTGGNTAGAAIYQVVSSSEECFDLHGGEYVIPTSGAMEVLDFDNDQGGRFYVCRRRFIRAVVDADLARLVQRDLAEAEKAQQDEFEPPGIGRTLGAI